MPTTKNTNRRTRREAAEDRVATLRAKVEEAQLKAALSYYTAADKGRKNRDWRPPAVSADHAYIPEAQTLIARSRHAVANSWIGNAAFRSQRRNVVGSGIKVVPTAKDNKGKDLAALNRRAADLFQRWANDKTACDVERRRSYWQTQRTMVGEEFVSGESFEVWSYAPNPRSVGLRLQLFEPEQLDTTITRFGDNHIRGGVEVDDFGAAVAYHFYKRNPNDSTPLSATGSMRVAAERVRHYFDAERVMQTRGVPKTAPVLPDVRDFDSFKSATLWRARMEACIGFMLKKNQPTPAGIGPSLPLASGQSATTSSGMRTLDMVPGMVPELLPGEDVVPFIPSSPGNQYDPFTTITLRGIGAGLGMSFGALTRHNDANYSAARQDMLEDEREIGPQQDALIHTVILPDYELWFRFAAIEGKFDGIDGFDLTEFLADPDRFLSAEYHAPERPWIDPEKEANAYATALKLRIMSRSQIVATQGGRLQNVLDQIKADTDEAAARNITFPEDLEAKATNAGAVADFAAAKSDYASADATKASVNQAPDPTMTTDKGPGVDSASAADRRPPRTVTLAQADAPNYRAADAPETSCSTCSYAVGMYCKAYDFNFTPGMTCDAWEAEPPSEPTNQRVPEAPPLRYGDVPIDARGGFTART